MITLSGKNRLKSQGRKMVLSDILTKETLILDLKAQNKFEAIEKMIIQLVLSGEIPKDLQSVIINEVIEREKLMPTGIDHGVAIPHAIAVQVDREIACFARANPPLDFDSQDGRPCDLLFLLLIPQDPVTPHIKTLSRIVHLFSNDFCRKRIREAQNVDELYAVFS